MTTLASLGPSGSALERSMTTVRGSFSRAGMLRNREGILRNGIQETRGFYITWTS